MQRNYYEVLGMPRAATQDEIKIKYRELARKFHPDIVHDKAFGLRIFKQINQAYRTLYDADRRAEYDASLDAAGVHHAQMAMATSRPAEAGTGTRNTSSSSASVDKMVREADVAMMEGQASSARSLCEAVLKADPSNVEALEILGDAHAHMKNNSEAIAAYRKVLSLSQSYMVEARLAQLEMAMQPSTVSNGNGRSGGVATETKVEPQKMRGNLLQRMFSRK